MHGKTTLAPCASSIKTSDALRALRERFGVQVTEADKDLARQLVTIYHDKLTPPFVSHLISESFYDLAKHYGIPLPKQWPRKWLAYWPTLLAVARFQGHLPTNIGWTFEPSKVEEAGLDAQEEEENYLRHVYDLSRDGAIPASERHTIGDALNNILNAAGVMDSFEVFRIAFPLALERLAEKKGDGDQ